MSFLKPLLFSFAFLLTSAHAQTADTTQRWQLANGMTLIVKPDHRAATAIQMLWVKVGSIDEVDGTSGVAHVLEHMMFKGTPTVPAGEFSKRIAALGGQDNAFTHYDYTAYYQKVPSSQVRAAMVLEADRFANIAFDNGEFAKEIEVIKEERRMRTDDQPRAAMQEMMSAVLYSASPYRRPIIGWMNDLEHMQADDARGFLHTWYTPQNAAVVIVGDVDPLQVKAWADELYGKIPNKTALPPRKPRLEPAQRGLRRMVFKAVAEQPVVAMAFKIPSFADAKLALSDPSPIAQDIYALVMLGEVLDGYPGARLARALTQGQGPARVADSVAAGAGLLGRGPETFVLQGIPAAGKTPAQLEAALRGQIELIAKKGVSAAELQRVKNQYAAGEIYKLDSLMGQAQEIGSTWALGLPANSTDILLERLSEVTAAQVQSVAQRYFGDDALTVATLLPQKSK